MFRRKSAFLAEFHDTNLLDAESSGYILHNILNIRRASLRVFFQPFGKPLVRLLPLYEVETLGYFTPLRPRNLEGMSLYGHLASLYGIHIVDIDYGRTVKAHEMVFWKYLQPNIHGEVGAVWTRRTGGIYVAVVVKRLYPLYFIDSDTAVLIADA